MATRSTKAVAATTKPSTKAAAAAKAKKAKPAAAVTALEPVAPDVTAAPAPVVSLTVPAVTVPLTLVPAPDADEDAALNTSLNDAMTAFRDSKPWRGTVAERKPKFARLHQALNRIYRKDVELVFQMTDTETPIGNGWVSLGGTAIGLVGKLSVVTFLRMWGTVLYKATPGAAQRWSVALYCRYFPRSAARMVQVDGMIMTPETAQSLAGHFAALASLSPVPPLAPTVPPPNTEPEARPRRRSRRAQCPDDTGAGC